MPIVRQKKFHPKGLPHLSDATTSTEFVAGAQLWSAELLSGNYVFTLAEEHAIDQDTDLLVVVRKKIGQS